MAPSWENFPHHLSCMSLVMFAASPCRILINLNTRTSTRLEHLLASHKLGMEVKPSQYRVSRRIKDMDRVKLDHRHQHITTEKTMHGVTLIIFHSTVRLLCRSTSFFDDYGKHRGGGGGYLHIGLQSIQDILSGWRTPELNDID